MKMIKMILEFLSAIFAISVNLVTVTVKILNVKGIQLDTLYFSEQNAFNQKQNIGL